MNFLIRTLFIVLLFSLSSAALAQTPDSKAKTSKAKNANLKAQQKKAYKKQEKVFRKKHMDRQSKEVKKRMKSNLKNTDSYYHDRRKPLFKRIFPGKYKH
jgi:hypothetical protein